MDNLVHVQSLQIKIRCVYAYASLLQANKLTDGAADDFQDTFHSEEKGFQKEKFCINSMQEDKICDLYDLYIQVFLCIMSNSYIGYSINNFNTVLNVLLV